MDEDLEVNSFYVACALFKILSTFLNVEKENLDGINYEIVSHCD